ncbi:acetyl-CoA carboxylase [Furfurilactobacillus siliginis]|uniref:Acetyl-CoA carboxylase n=1 Tax=Furfurilactobacillus siliginis TaxID=348151 RepID=A0A0R2KZM4_9LACO|nr:acetyl-CoA carboxylase [Furfurilactobacillus siliginis]KRN94704.1 hypothetical protein IV55_GL000474 [Furfurilactobacillus siliginis]GEK28416.1 hypothetical protein LSI01_07270 [Furfurilactobacillus siliginis]
MISDLQVITKRLDALFVRKRNVRYWLQVVDDPYDQTYNFFFDSRLKGHREKSVPLHTITHYDLAYLETVIISLKKHTQLSVLYEGFTGQHWPSNYNIIQKRRHWDE